jgi:large repetitive protein
MRGYFFYSFFFIAFLIQISSVNTISAQSDLSLTLTSSTNTPELFVEFELIITVVNNGPSMAQELQICVPIKPGFPIGETPEIVSLGSYDGAGGIWTIGNLPAGVTATLTLPLFPITTSYTAFTAEVCMTTALDPDSSPNNLYLGLGEDDESILILPYDPANPIVDLDLSFESNYNEVPAGQTFLATLTAKNFSGHPCDTSQVKVTLPEGMVIQAWQGTVADGDFDITSQIWSLDTLDPNSSQSITLILKSDSLGSTGVFAQVIAASNQDIDSSPDNNSTSIPSAEDDEVLLAIDILDANSPQADLEVTMFTTNWSPQPQTYVFLIIKVKNNGPSESNFVQLHYFPPAGFGYDDASATIGDYGASTGGYWNIPNILSGETAILTIRLYVTATSEMPHFAEIIAATNYDLDSQPGNDVVQTDDEDDEVLIGFPIPPVIPKLSDLELNLAYNQDFFYPGDTIDCVLDLVNAGDSIASNLLISIAATSGLQLIYTSDSSVIDGTWTPDDLPIDSSVSVHLTYLTLQNKKDQRFFSEVVTQYPLDYDSYANNGNGAFSHEDDEAALSIPYTVDSSKVDIFIELHAQDPTFEYWKAHPITIVATNEGFQTTSLLEIGFNVPAGFRTANGITQNGKFDYLTATWQVDSLRPGQTDSCIVFFFCVDSVAPAQFQAQITACSHLDMDSEPNNAQTGLAIQDDEAILSLTHQISTIIPVVPTPNTEQQIVIQYLWPNPCDDHANVCINSTVATTLDLNVIDRVGKRMGIIKLDLPAGQSVHVIDLTKLPTGEFYLVNPTDPKIRDYKAFLKQ